MNSLTNDPMYGFRASHRIRWQLLGERILTEKQLLLYEYLIDLADRGERHKKYGMFEFFAEELVSVFHKTSETIGDWFERLCELGFVVSVDVNRSRYKIIKYERYTTFHASEYAKLEAGLPIRKVLASWELVGDYSKKISKKTEKIPKKGGSLLKSINSRVSVPSKKESRILDGFEFSEHDLAEIFFGGDMSQFYLHWRVNNEMIDLDRRDNSTGFVKGVFERGGV